jgi:hypothetical protein
LLQRRLIETLGQRYIDAARLRSHAPSSEFWSAWKAFTGQTVKARSASSVLSPLNKVAAATTKRRSPAP